MRLPNYHRDTQEHQGFQSRGVGVGGYLPANETGEDTPQGLNAQGQRRDIQKQQVCHISLHDAPLDGSARSHHLIRVDPPAGLPLEQVLHNSAHLYKGRAK